MARTGTASRPARRSASSASRRAPWRRSASRRRSAASVVSGSTATATTAIDNPPTRQYVGRFAPSPTGKLHLGSLVAALGSYADARSHGGRWLVRMEDLDRARVRTGAADEILRTLEMFGLRWDGGIEYQSERTEHYLEALEALMALGTTFECSCSRRERDGEGGYPGTCRAGPRRSGPTATRFRVEDVVVSV